jgi:putative hydrolase of the HAD superfamily
MKPKLVTFDCANTLVRVDWQPAVLAVKSASRAGLKFDRQVAAEVYDRKLRTQWPEFMRLNLQRNEAVLAEFWHRLTVEWMRELGMPEDRASDVVKVANDLLFGEGSQVFTLYDDVLPCLDRLRTAGFRMAIVSNWDNSLHRTLAMFGLNEYFEVVLASLEEGVEKPDPRLFLIALARTDVAPQDALHIGDNPVDDWLGAKNAGIKALVIDREADSRSDLRITSLLQLAEELGA